ncbi:MULTISPECIES: lactonase family protein [unclassified Chelatococcus]|uniref:lactonase family protein n=1 Tax=unclassified Chelatococcus TaxID=2638111 RepID=UPI001BD0C007|nr:MULTISPECIES: lactonase family protein [unclassified Chelatococcus]CAH1672942.1 6-phosphogluconolactonase [Hyphomicrobiales bacterium]MBS7738653.1 lactonase family protein [Chelatococcus sp. HY11]MBX3543057.1 lactonase family protein [Chelatococcus sp.]MCO5076817.1 lactonase family protein [Chelatococcus sp.]CAH1674817.1 6-phosphogluconolactonase [Hyphomicrobiales bacterium]
MTDCHFLVGSFTESYADFRAAGEGISLVRLGEDGHLALVDRVDDLPNPSYLKPIGPNRCLATLEVDDARSGIATIAADHEAGRLHLLHRQTTPGQVLCHLDVDPTGQWLAGAFYGSGHVLTRAVDADGRVSEAGGMAKRHGHSVHPIRQTIPHPHAVRFSPDGSWIVVPDLGTDEVASYAFTNGELASTPSFIWRAPAGAGPRLVHFSRDGRYVLLVHELTSEVSSLSFRGGRLEEIARVSTLRTAFTGENTAAGLHWHPTRSTFAVSNRGAHAITFFEFDDASGAISPWFDSPSGGDKPRDFAFSPCGRWVITANQNDDSVMVWDIDWQEGRGRFTGFQIKIGTPSCIRFMK